MAEKEEKLLPVKEQADGTVLVAVKEEEDPFEDQGADAARPQQAVEVAVEEGAVARLGDDHVAGREQRQADKLDDLQRAVAGEYPVDGDPPALDHHPGLAGRDEDPLEARGVRGGPQLERHRHLADRAVGAHGVHDAHPIGAREG